MESDPISEVFDTGTIVLDTSDVTDLSDIALVLEEADDVLLQQVLTQVEDFVAADSFGNLPAFDGQTTFRTAEPTSHQERRLV